MPFLWCCQSRHIKRRKPCFSTVSLQMQMHWHKLDQYFKWKKLCGRQYLPVKAPKPVVSKLIHWIWFIMMSSDAELKAQCCWMWGNHVTTQFIYCFVMFFSHLFEKAVLVTIKQKVENPRYRASFHISKVRNISHKHTVKHLGASSGDLVPLGSYLLCPVGNKG